MSYIGGGRSGRAYRRTAEAYMKRSPVLITRQASTLRGANDFVSSLLALSATPHPTSRDRPPLSQLPCALCGKQTNVDRPRDTGTGGRKQHQQPLPTNTVTVTVQQSVLILIVGTSNRGGCSEIGMLKESVLKTETSGGVFELCPVAFVAQL